jgi:hypothetical protein
MVRMWFQIVDIKTSSHVEFEIAGRKLGGSYWSPWKQILHIRAGNDSLRFLVRSTDLVLNTGQVLNDFGEGK